MNAKIEKESRGIAEGINWSYSVGLLALIVLSVAYIMGMIPFWPLDRMYSMSKCPDVVKKYWTLIFLGVVGYIFYLITFLRPWGLDKSEYDFMYITEDKKGQFTNWEWSHIFAYVIFALICPNDWKFVFIAGMAFEVFELVVGYISGDRDFWTSQSQNLISFTDIKANLLGYSIGHVIRGFLGD